MKMFLPPERVTEGQTHIIEVYVYRGYPLASLGGGGTYFIFLSLWEAVINIRRGGDTCFREVQTIWRIFS